MLLGCTARCVTKLYRVFTRSYTVEIIDLPYRERLTSYWKEIAEKAQTKYGDIISLQYPEDYDREAFLVNYVKEIWLSELRPPAEFDTVKLFSHVLSKNEDREVKFKESVKKMHPKLAEIAVERWWLELSNLNDAARFVLDKEQESVKISEEFIKKVHYRVAFDVIELPGQYRDGYVGTAGNMMYASPNQIQHKLSALVDFVNKTLSELDESRNDNETIQAICLGGYFLSEFLLIHPFYDGNGRTARILLSHIILSYTFVPLSLFCLPDADNPISKYIQALEAEGRTTIPWAVIDFVFECAVANCKNTVWQKES